MVLATVLLSLVAALAQDEAATAADSKPRILILGDSISIGYTPHVREMLKDEAVVIRPMNNEKASENCAGTTKGVEHVDRWLLLSDTPSVVGEAGTIQWDVIHFNFGLHDLKRVQPDSGKNSTDPAHPRQAEPDVYEKQLRAIVKKLKATGAKLIFATTTPVPEGGVRPHRDVTDPARYNAIAARVMAEHEVAVNDLYAFILPQCDKYQKKVDVHFTPDGSKTLGEQVAKVLRNALKQR